MTFARSMITTRLTLNLLMSLAVYSTSLGADKTEDIQPESLKPDVPFADHLVRKFVQRDGLPSNWVRDIIQTRDGYIWIGTHNGVARYDGVRFRVFNRSNTPELPANDARTFCETSDGKLWIGTIGGLARFTAGRPGRFERFKEFDGIGVAAIFEDRSGKLWLGTREEMRVRDDAAEADFHVIEGSPHQVQAICEDNDGRIWLGAKSGLYVLKDKLERLDHPRLSSAKSIDGGIPFSQINALLADPSGGVWIGANQGMLHFKDGRFDSAGVEIGQLQIYDIFQTRNGGLYAATRYGLFRSTEGRFEKLATELSSMCGFEDREGGLWVGHWGNRALHHYRNNIVRTELRDQLVNCVYEHSDGSMCFGTTSGLHVLKNGNFRTYQVADGLPHNYVTSIAKSNQDGFWIATRGGLARWTEGDLVMVPNSPRGLTASIVTLFEDSVGKLWIGFNITGGCTLQEDVVQELDQIGRGQIQWFTEDDDGAVLIGHEYGLYRRHQGRLTQVRDPAFDRLNSNHFRSFCRTRDGTMWLATSGGIVRYQSGSFSAITSENGLSADYIDGIGVDNLGNLWMETRDGV